MTMINVYDPDLKKTAVLQNAMNIVETQELNAVYSLEFELPADDDKARYCQAYHYIRYGEDGQLYRLIGSGLVRNTIGVRRYRCEHVIATLVDDVLFGSFVVGNAGMPTAATIRWILERQTVQRWVLGRCDFDQQLEYGWEHENLLTALYSVPKSFVALYRFDFNTRVYPWRLELRRIDEAGRAQYYLRAEKNLLESDEEQDSLEVCTRLYGLGYGEGVNQLTISAVNGGKPYLESSPSAIAKYGLINRIYVDRSFENAEMLKARMTALLKEMERPQFSRSFRVTDLYELTRDPLDRAEVGQVAALTADGTRAIVTKTKQVLDEAGSLEIELSTKATDIASSIADLANRQRIESTYAQGSTQLYAQSISENATHEKGARLSFYLPGEMRYVNKITAKIELKRFRAFNRQTKGGGKSVRTSSAGGGSVTTSSASGSGSFNSEENVEIYTTSSPSQNFTHGVLIEEDETDDSGTLSMSGAAALSSSPRDTSQATAYPGQQHKHRIDLQHYHHLAVSGANHRHSVLRALSKHEHNMHHTHQVAIPPHKHLTFISAHTHKVQVPEHTHKVELPEHKHEIEQGIFEYGSPQSAEVWIEGTKRLDIGKSGEFDLTPHILNSSGKIPRGRWIDVEVRPNDLAYIRIHLFVQGFIQSRGGGNY